MVTLDQKIDAKTSLWLFVCLICGLVLAPMIVGGAGRGWLDRLTVVTAVTLAAAILGAMIKSQIFALCCGVLLTWPAFAYTLLVVFLRKLAMAGQTGSSPDTVGLILFATVLMILSPAVVYLVGMFWGPARGETELAARVKLEA